MLMPLKQKYLTQKSFTGGKYKSRTGNSHATKKSIWKSIQENARKKKAKK